MALPSANSSSLQPTAANTSKGQLLIINDLTFAYKSGFPILRGINLELSHKETIGLAGRNGSGKTTLFRCIAGLETGFSGTLAFIGKSIKNAADFAYVRRHTGYVVQNSDNQFVFPTVMEDVMFGPLNLGLTREEADEAAHFWLDKLGITALGERIIANLSGGEKKMAALAGILAMRPELLLLDEPLNELDETASKRLLVVLKDLDCAKIIASHQSDIFNALHCPVDTLADGGLKKSEAFI